MTEQELQQNIKKREWRLSNLYFIKDDAGNRIKFKLNWTQNWLLNHLWYLNVILKARQLGITTFFCILYLDDVLFTGKDAGLIAHTREAAEKIFDTKIRYAWDNLPESIKNEFQVDSDTARQLSFRKDKRESSIYVGTSLRSTTVQRLHVSELGTTDQKYPAKSEEIKTGALNTVHKGQIITIESTAKGDVGVFADICKEAIDNMKSGRELSKLDWNFIFFPWFKHPEYRISGERVIPLESKEYFEKIEQETGETLTQEQKNWYFLKSKTQGDAMKSEFPSTPQEAFEASIEGAYYGKQMTRVMEEKRIKSVPWIPNVSVDTYWDLGIAKKKTDATSILFVQDIGLEVHIIDFYGNSGEGLAHYIKYLNKKPYTYGRNYGPHDLEVKELGTGKTRLEIARQLGLRMEIVPKLPFSDGIEAGRMVLSKCWFDEEKTAELVKALKSYRKEWDDKLGKFKDRPLQDWSCDPADAFRYMALGHKDHQRLGFYDKEEEELAQIREYQSNIGKQFNPLNPFE